MDFSQFLLEIMNNPQEYFIYLAISWFIMYFIFHKQVVSLLDNITILLIFGFGIYFSTILFMYSHGELEDISLCHFMISMMAFIVGYWCCGRLKRPIKKDYIWDNHSEYIFTLSVLIFLISSLYLSIIKGVPLLAEESRIGFYKDAGFVKNISNVFQIAVTFFLIEKISILNKITLRQSLLIMLLFTWLFLSGSKAAFANLLIAYNLYTFYFTDKKCVASKYILVCFLLFITIIAIKTKGNYEYLLIETIGAIIGRADVYVDFYGNGYNTVLNFFNEEGFDNFLLNVFYSVLLKFRIISYDDELLKYSWADKMSLYVSGNTFSGGVNNVMNVFSLTYLGFFGSIICMLVIGIMFGWIRNKFIFKIKMDNVFVRLMFFITLMRLPFLFGMIHGFIDVLMTSCLLLGGTYVLVIVLCRYIGVKGEGYVKKNKLEHS